MSFTSFKNFICGAFSVTQSNGNMVTTGTAQAAKILTPEVKTDTSAATDLTITTGASKTILLTNVAKISMRPFIEQGSVAGAGKPTIVTRGCSKGYSLPLYAADEELFISEYIAGRWDGASDITLSVIGYLSSAETADDDFALQLSWANKATGSGTWSDSTNDTTVVTNIPDARKAQYSIYKVDFTIDWDLPATDIAASDFFAGRIRRVAVGVGNVEMDGEFVITSIVITYSVNKVFKAA